MSATATTVKKNLFGGAKVKEPAATKKGDKKTIRHEALENKIAMWSEIKKRIEAQTGTLKMLEGDIKEAGRGIFLTEYENDRSTPDNFRIEDKTGAACLFIVQDKYTTVDEIKSEVLGMYEGLLLEKTTYTVDAELVEEYGEVLSDLIMNCDDIKEEDKERLIKGEKTFSVKKGSIDRLMQYENPKEIFELINPIVALKK